MSIKKFIKSHSVFYLSLIFVLLVIRYFLFQLPLFKNLDLEIAIVFSFILGIVSSYSTLHFLNKGENLLEIILSFIIIIFGFFLIFLATDCLVNNCPITIGIFFFPLFVTTSTLFGVSLAVLIHSIGKIRSYVLLTILFLILIIYSLLEYYFEPQHFLYNPLIIFYPGLGYDELFELNFEMIIYCAVILITSLIITSRAYFKERWEENKFQKLKIHFDILPVILLSSIFLFSDELNLSTSHQKLERQFPVRLKSDHFEILFQRKEIFNKFQEVFKITTEYHYDYLSKLLNVHPEKIRIYVFANDQLKKNLLGVELADFTKPWQRQIFTTEETFHKTIKHELSHVFLGERLTNLFKVPRNFNLALIEGGATALECEWLERPPTYFAALINRFVSEIKASDYFENIKFATRLSYISYLVSGSFCKWLIDNYGAEKFLSFYQMGNFENVYGEPINQSFEKFKMTLNDFRFKELDSLKALSLFGGVSFFEKNCPRAFARINKKAKEYLSNQRYEDAEKLYQKIFERRNDYESLTNLIRSKFYQRKFSDVVRFYENSDFYLKVNGISSIRAQIIYALSLAKQNRKQEAVQIFDKLKSIDISNDWNSYIDVLTLLVENPHDIDVLISKPYLDFLKSMFSKYPDNLAILKSLIKWIPDKELDFLTKHSEKDFWTLNQCFFTNVERGNFVKANEIIKIIQTNHLVDDEVKEYQYNLMNFILIKIKINKGVK